MRRSGVKPVNHAANNRKALRQAQEANREAKEREHEQQEYKKELRATSFYAQAAPRVYEEREEDENAERRDFLRKSEGLNNATRMNRLPQRSADDHYYEEEMRYQEPKAAVPRGTMAQPEKRERNFLAANARAAVRKSPPKQSQKPIARDLSNYKNQGQVPEYLQRRKEELADMEQEYRRREEEADLPPGMTLMPEDERLETLSILNEKKAEIEQMMRALPLKIETVGQRRRQAELDGKMQEIEKALQTFGKKKVYISL